MSLQRLSPAEKRVAMTLIADFPITALKTLVEISTEAGVSPATVSRFTETLGFSGFPDFQRAVHEDVVARFASPGALFDRPPETTDHAEGKMAASRSFAKLISDTLESLDMKEVALLVSNLADPKRTIYLLGGRHSGPLARYFQQQLHHLRRHTFYLASVNAEAVDALVEFDSRTTVVVFDFRRYQKDTANFVTAAAARRAHIVLVTDPYMSPAVKYASQAFICHTSTGTPFDSYTSALAFVDFLTQLLSAELEQAGHDRVSRLEQAREEFGLEYVMKK